MNSAQLKPARQRTGKRHGRGRGWNVAYYLREGFSGIFRHGLMSFATVCMIIACLLIMGTFSLVAVDLEANQQKMEQENEFSAYVDDSLSVEQAMALQDSLLAIPNVKEAVFVHQKEVLEQFREDHPDEDGLFALLPDDVFQHKYIIRVHQIDILEETVSQVEQTPGISDTSAGIEIAEGMVALRNVATGVALVLVLLLVLVSLFIIANTLRLALFYRRDEIAIMKMCGATNGFIRWPFVLEGIILGLTSAVAAFFLQWLIYDTMANAAAEGQLRFLIILPFAGLWKWVLLCFCGAGVVIGVLGSILAIRRFLKV